MTLNIYTKAGRKISVGVTFELSEQVINAYKTNASYSLTLRDDRGTNYTIPLDNIDYIEVR